MSNAFEQACRVEIDSRAIIEPLLERHTNGRFVYTDKGRLAKEFQAKYGDLLIQEKRGKEMLAVEMKAERKSSPNLFLEIFSNGSRYKPGWMLGNEADLLFYHFLDADDLYIIKLPDLKNWFWFGIGPMRASGKRLHYLPAYMRWKHKQQKQYNQMNDTWGVLVPLANIAMEVGMKKVNPLGLFGIRDAS